MCFGAECYSIDEMTLVTTNEFDEEMYRVRVKLTGKPYIFLNLRIPKQLFSHPCDKHPISVANVRRLSEVGHT